MKGTLELTVDQEVQAQERTHALVEGLLEDQHGRVSGGCRGASGLGCGGFHHLHIVLDVRAVRKRPQGRFQVRCRGLPASSR